jgi:hypothetical protein
MRRREFMRALRRARASVSAVQSCAIDLKSGLRVIRPRGARDAPNYFIVGMTNSALPPASGQRLVTVFRRV